MYSPTASRNNLFSKNQVPPCHSAVVSDEAKYFGPRGLIDDTFHLYDKSSAENFAPTLEEFSTDSIIMWKYLRRWRKRYYAPKTLKFSNQQELIEHLDKVDENLIAKFEVEQAFRQAPSFARDVMKFALPDNESLLNELGLRDEVLNVSFNNPKVIEETMERKGVPADHIKNAMVANAIWEALVGNKNLFSTDDKLKTDWEEDALKFLKFSQQQHAEFLKEQQQNNDTLPKDQQQNLQPEKVLEKQQEEFENDKQTKWTEAKLRRMRKMDHIIDKIINCYANLFLVDKSALKEGSTKFLQRIILDGRLANALLKNEAKMELFSVEALIQRVGDLFLRGHNAPKMKLFAAQADLRHWFHQLPFPRRYARFFRMNFGNNRYAYPRAWPMGFHMSPGVAQACTWSILLRNVEDNVQLREKLQIDWPEGKQFSYLQWLPLKNGGAIFVCIDNIFIITPDETTRENWIQHISTAASDLKAVLKPTSNDPEGAPQFFEKVDFLSSNKETSISFCGIEFSRKGRRTKDNIDKVPCFHDKRDINNNIIAPASNWMGTYRELATIIGQCLWTYSVRGTALLDLDDFLDLYQHSFPRSSEGWDTQIDATTTNSQIFQDVLRKHYFECFDDKPNRKYHKYRLSLPQDKICCIASDAALEEKKEKNYLGALWCLLYEENKPAFQQDPTNNNKIVNVAAPKVFQEVHQLKQIALAELKAVIKTIQDVKVYCRKNNIEEPNLYMVAIDSMAAKGMISRGFSKQKEARELLKELRSELQIKDSFGNVLGERKIFLHWIASELNPGDAPSREEEALSTFNLQKWKNCLEMLINCIPTAQTLFEVRGKTRVQPTATMQQQQNAAMLQHTTGSRAEENLPARRLRQ